MNKKKWFLLFFLSLLLGGVFIFSIQKQETTEQKIISFNQQTLSKEAYQKIRDELVTITNNQNPQETLTFLREKIKTDDALARSCHALVHEIGQNAYQKYNDFGEAMKYQDEVCNSGYLHGIIEAHFSKSADIFTTLQSVCATYKPTSFIGWECYHGVGHGLMYFTQNILPRSLSLCDTYENIDARSACVNGVFMENFNTDQKLHPSRYLKSSDPFFPCNEQKSVHQGDCYLYAPSYYLNLHKNDYHQAIKWCRTAGKDFQLICINGVGAQMMKENSNNPKFVESICMSDKNGTEACIDGLVGLYINHFGGLDEAKILCNKLEKANQPICEQTIVSRKGFFQN